MLVVGYAGTAFAQSSLQTGALGFVMEDLNELGFFKLLQPERIGCVLTENWQIDPEQSTSAIIVHHPEAKYYAAR